MAESLEDGSARQSPSSSDLGGVSWLYNKSEELGRALQRNFLLQSLVGAVALLYVFNSPLTADILGIAGERRLSDALIIVSIPVVSFYLFASFGYLGAGYLYVRARFVNDLPPDQQKDLFLYRNFTNFYPVAALVSEFGIAAANFRFNASSWVPYFIMLLHIPVVIGVNNATTVYFTWRILGSSPGLATILTCVLVALILATLHLQFLRAMKPVFGSFWWLILSPGLASILTGVVLFRL